SFFGSLKCEWLGFQTYKTRAEARQDIFAYIEGFYNKIRLHSTLGYNSPDRFEFQNYQSLNPVSI
ncbi:MAG: integrase, partial [Anaerolineaceae bacterium]|nr:integrase [Anaerolineaceae bacterium]